MSLLPRFDEMTKIRKVVAFTLSSIGIALAGWLGFHLAGVIAMILFAPLGALAGLFLGAMPLMIMVEFIADVIRLSI